MITSEFSINPEVLSPRSSAQFNFDFEQHGNQSEYDLSNQFLKKALAPQTVEARENLKLVIETISEGNLRVEILAFMLRVAASCEMSDETFFHSVHMAEKVLTKLHQEYLEKVAD